LKEDLKAHAAQPVKFIFSHRPSWLISVVLHNPNFALHQLARQYGVQYVIAATFIRCCASIFRGDVPLDAKFRRETARSQEYADGWFFGHALVAVQGTDIDFQN